MPDWLKTKLSLWFNIIKPLLFLGVFCEAIQKIQYIFGKYDASSFLRKCTSAIWLLGLLLFFFFGAIMFFGLEGKPQMQYSNERPTYSIEPAGKIISFFQIFLYHITLLPACYLNVFPFGFNQYQPIVKRAESFPGKRKKADFGFDDARGWLGLGHS